MQPTNEAGSSETDAPPTGWKERFIDGFRNLWQFTGPGAMISTAFMNTGSIGANVKAGSDAKYQLLWMGLLSAVIAVVLQRLSARLGSASRTDLADHCSTFYCRAPRIFKWLLMELTILSCDMQNVIGITVSLYILSLAYIPMYAGVILSFFDMLALLLIDKYGLRKMDILFALFVVAIAVTFGFEYVSAMPNQADVLQGILTPFCRHCSQDVYIQIVSIIGASLTPHSLFLHSGLVKEKVEKAGLDKSDAKAVRRVHSVLFWEVCLAVSLSYAFNVFVTAAIGATVHGETNAQLREECVASGSPFSDVFPDDEEDAEADLYSGGVLLGCRFGRAALVLWAMGLLAASLAGSVHTTRAGKMVMQGFVQVDWHHWQRSLAVRIVSATPLLFVAVYTDMPTFVSINAVLNVVLSLHLPAAALPTIALTANKTIMGDHTSSIFSTISSLLLTGGVVSTNAYMLVRLVWEWLPHSWGFAVGAVLLALGYLAHIVYLLLDMASSTGTSKALATCSLGQRFLNQPCG